MITEMKRIIKDSEIMKEDDSKMATEEQGR